MSSDMHRAALSYAARGWPVFPIHSINETEPGRCTCGNAKCSKPGKHPRTTHGLKDASTDTGQIDRWFTRSPSANVAIRTGVESNLVVLDEDPRHGGDKSLAQLVAQHAPIPVTPCIKTGGGGRHFYFRHPGGDLRNRVSFLPGLDVRGDGGYVAASPSIHESGETYQWLPGHSPSDVELAEMPGWLLDRVRPTTSAGRDELLARARAYVDRAGAASEGERNSSAFRLAGQLRAFVDSDGNRLEESVIFDLMRGWNERCSPPLDTSELAACVNSSAKNGTRRADKPPRASSQHTGAPDGEVHYDHSGRPLTDSGNAERLVERFGKDIRYCTPWKKWLVWDGKHWRIDDRGKVLLHTKSVARQLYVDAARIDDPEVREKTIKWARNSEKAERRKAMLAMAMCEPGVAILPGELDRDTYLINCTNGTVNLKDGVLTPHRREDYITKISRAAFNPEAKCPVWERTLERILPDDEVRSFLQRTFGYSLTGDVSEQVILILQGDGANGKSTIMSTLLWLLTGSYAIQIAADLLLDKGQRNHPTELADLFGVRMAVGTELNENQYFDEALVKQLTGGDPIRARRMKEDFWQFDPTHKLFLVTNHVPRVRGTDHAIWRRLNLIRFEVTLPKSERDKKLLAKLRAERDGILAWLVRGCTEWQRTGLCAPDGVQLSPSPCAAEIDVVAQWVAECVTRSPGSRSGATEMYRAFLEWCSANDYSPISQTEFGTRMGNNGIGRKKTGGIIQYVDVVFRDATEAKRDGWGQRGTVSGLTGQLPPHEDFIAADHPFYPQPSLGDADVAGTSDRNVPNDNGLTAFARTEGDA